jgi:hypothetical protein
MTVGRGVREQVKRVSGVSLGRTGSGGNPSSAAMELQRIDTPTLGSLDLTHCILHLKPKFVDRRRITIKSNFKYAMGIGLIKAYPPLHRRCNSRVLEAL